MIIQKSLFSCVLLASTFAFGQLTFGQSQWGGISGDWDIATNWIGGVPTTPTDSALLGGTSSYNVLFDAGYTIADLEITNQNAVLTFDSSVGHNLLFVNDDVTNNGRVNLNSNNAFLSAVFDVDGTFTNSSTGIVSFGGVELNSNVNRSLRANNLVNNGFVVANENGEFRRATVSNNGSIQVAVGKNFEIHCPTFNQNAGSIVVNQGQFEIFNSEINYNGGSFTGNAVDVNGSTLNIGSGSIGAAEFNIVGATPNTRLTGDVASTQTLNINAQSTIGTILHVDTDTINHGTINLNTEHAFRNVTFSRAGTITNAATGTLNFSGTNATNATRILDSSLFNQGTINVNQNATISHVGGTFSNNALLNVAAGKELDFSLSSINQDNGTILNTGTTNVAGGTFNFNGGSIVGNAINLNSSTLNIGSGSTGVAVFNLRGFNANTLISGDVAAAQTINILPSSVSTQVTATSDFTNLGTINLNSDVDFRHVKLRRAGTITNGGTIAFGGSSTSNSTIRHLDAELNNLASGTLDIVATGTGTTVGMAGANHSNSGTIVSQNNTSTVTFLGASFSNDAGGLLAGTGEFDFSATSLINNGEIAPGHSAGTLNLDGDILFGATSDLKIELGGLIQGTEYDFLNALDGLTLGGDLSVEFINGFESLVSNGDSFSILSSSLLNGTFSGLADGATLATTNGGSFTINYSGNDVMLSNYSAVPEPHASSLILIGLVGLLRRRRRRSYPLESAC